MLVRFVTPFHVSAQVLFVDFVTVGATGPHRDGAIGPTDTAGISKHDIVVLVEEDKDVVGRRCGAARTSDV